MVGVRCGVRCGECEVCGECKVCGECEVWWV